MRAPADQRQEITFFRQRVEIVTHRTNNHVNDVTVSLNGTPPQRIGRGTVAIERVPIATGEALIARVTGEQPGAAVIAGSPTILPEILQAGPQLVVGEDAVDRTETIVVVRDMTGDGRPDVVVGQRRPELTLCGLGAPLINTRAISPTSLRLSPVHMDPIASLATAPTGTVRTVAAVPVDASASMLNVPLLSGTGRSVGGVLSAPATQLNDLHPNTVWTGNSQDFVVLRVLPADLPIERLVFTVGPVPAQFPRELSVIVGSQRINVTFNPALTQVAGARVAVPLVPPIAASCAAIILGGTQNSQAIADVLATSALDHTENAIDGLVLSLNEPQGEHAVGILHAIGIHAIRSLREHFATLNAQGARRAVRILAAFPQGESAEALVQALGRDETTTAARDALLRMGPVAFSALSTMTTTDARAVAILRAMRGDITIRADAAKHAVEAEPAVWHESRGHLQALLSELPNQEALLRWVNNRVGTLLERDRRAVYRSLAVGLAAAQDEPTRSAITARALAIQGESFGEKFLRLSSLGGSPEGIAELGQILRGDNDSDLRDEAARVLVSLSARVDSVRPVLRGALTDQTPRVRITALAGLHGDEPSRVLIERTLHDDRWPIVRAAAAETLIGMPSATNALLTALDDPSVIVVRATLNTLAQTPGTPVAARLVAFARDTHRYPDLRVDALAAIGQRCDQSAIGALEELVVDRVDPALPDEEQRVGHAALGTIARLNPARARVFLQRMDGNAFAVAAVERAARHACPVTPQ